MSHFVEAPHSSISYWKEALRGAPTKLELPTDKPRPPIQTHGRAIETFVLSDELVARLRSVGQAEQATSFMTLAAGFVVLLNRYTGQDDLLIATALRDNTAVLRLRLTDELDFRSLLRQVRDRTLDVHADGVVEFERLVAELVPEPDPSHAPLCQVMFAHADVDESPPRSSVQAPMYDLKLRVSESLQTAEGSIAYSTDLFEPGTIKRLCGHYVALLESLARDPDKGISSVSMLGEHERATILYDWNETHEPLPQTSAIRLFEEQVERTPDAIAVGFEGKSLTYRELNERANKLGHYLRARGVGPEVIVGVCLARSFSSR
jgi:non-ribosomal peptide synthetase component F